MTLASPSRTSMYSAYLRLMRLHQRTGIWLLLWPCWWSIAMARAHAFFTWETAKLLLLFALGAVIMRSAGCVVNDIWDRNLDPHVERTRLRPLASGELNVRQALMLLGVLLSAGLVILLSLNLLTIVVGICFAALVVLYPLMKRIMPVPQVFLGLTFNAGALMGYSAATGDISAAAWVLYGACFFWTLGYDTVYAHQDARDDAKIGIRSAALTFAQHSRIHITLYYLLATGGWLLAGVLTAQPWPYATAVGLTGAYLTGHTLRLDLEDTERCHRGFAQHALLGWVPFVGLVLSALYLRHSCSFLYLC